AFLQGLAILGWGIGHNLRIETRWATPNITDIRRHSAELAALAPDVILAGGGSSVGPLLESTRTVPVVFTVVTDPVGAGYVANLNRPGGNVTGVSFISADLGAKQLGLLRELRPGAARIAVLVDPKWPTTERFVSQLRAAALAVGQQLIVLDVKS